MRKPTIVVRCTWWLPLAGAIALAACCAPNAPAHGDNGTGGSGTPTTTATASNTALTAATSAAPEAAPAAATGPGPGPTSAAAGVNAVSSSSRPSQAPSDISPVTIHAPGPFTMAPCLLQTDPKVGCIPP